MFHGSFFLGVDRLAVSTININHQPTKYNLPVKLKHEIVKKHLSFTINNQDFEESASRCEGFYIKD